MSAVTEARALMEAFATRTGLVGDRPSSRYLWTDAFAVCNFLGLYQSTEQPSYLSLAADLAREVHEVLGSYADGDERSGWLCDMDDAQHRMHPTRCGLRIGKKMTERGPDEPFEERLEWERDGQYFHYLTRWMHALEQLARVTDDHIYHQWAVDLYLAAHAGFVYRGGPGNAMPRMYWKMSVDLSRPLVESMGHHDPLDGWITGVQLRESKFVTRDEQEKLARPLDEFREMCAARSWATGDPLGIGGLLTDAWRLDELLFDAEEITTQRIAGLLHDANLGLSWQVENNQMEGPAIRRLAFRELGLAIGLHAIERLPHVGQSDSSEDNADDPVLAEAVGSARRFVPLAAGIENFWLETDNQRSPSWSDHLDINSVMLATSLVPGGYLLSGAEEIRTGKPESSPR